MDELPAGEWHRVRGLFDGEHLALVVEAVIAGNSPGTVWVDDVATPGAAAIWDGAHCLYLGGAVGRVGVFREVADRRLGPARPGLVKIYAAENNARAVFAGYELKRRERVFYRGDQAGISGWRDRRPAGVAVSSINEEFGRLGALAGFEEVTAEIESCWPSMAGFRRAGFGFCAHDGESIVCWCTAEYVSDGRCGIGIATIPACQGRGLATLTTAAFVEHCAARGITPHWDSWSANLPSVAVAEKAGFTKIETYSTWVVNLA